MHDAQERAAQAQGISASDTIRDLRCGDWAWFSKAVLKMKLGWKANLVYMGLVSFANSSKQSCFPSIATLAELLSISEDTVTRGLKDLKEANLVSIIPRKNGDLKTSNEYVLLPVRPDTANSGIVPANSGPADTANSGEVPAVSGINKKNKQELEENNNPPIAPTEPIEPDSADCRILCELVGIFEIRQQETMHRRYKAFVKSSGLSVVAARTRMVSQWEIYQREMPKLEWAFSGAAKFFESAIWNQTPDKWPYPKGSQKKDPFANMKFINSGGKK
jgi:hypothetical protein